MPIGKVKWFDIKKGFGFIQDGDGQDVFVHYSVIEGGGFRRLVDNEKVEYELAQGPKGLLAARVRRLEPDGDGHPGKDGQPGHDGNPGNDGQKPPSDPHT